MQNLKFFNERLIMWWWVSDLFWTRYFLVFCPGSAILLNFFWKIFISDLRLQKVKAILFLHV